MSSVDQAKSKASSFLSGGCNCSGGNASDFARSAGAQIKSVGKTQSAMTSGTAKGFSPQTDSTVADHRLYGFGGEQTRVDRQRASQISDAAQSSFFDGLDQVKTNRQNNADRQAYHSSALDEIYKSIGIKPREAG